ncbi:MAG: peptidyl-dipeptidase Dcp, partial [Acidobacteria bacterium]|nr:peptidyl-dipeptidase Dcp [Acidobacteriota bacterium]
MPAPAPQSAPSATTSNTAATANPFFTASTLPFQAPPFDRIKDSDYQPAIEEGMRQELAEIATIANSSEPPTFTNTIEAMERTGTLLTRVVKVFSALSGSNTNDTIQKVEAEV